MGRETKTFRKSGVSSSSLSPSWNRSNPTSPVSFPSFLPSFRSFPCLQRGLQPTSHPSSLQHRCTSKSKRSACRSPEALRLCAVLSHCTLPGGEEEEAEVSTISSINSRPKCPFAQVATGKGVQTIQRLLIVTIQRHRYKAGVWWVKDAPLSQRTYLRKMWPLQSQLYCLSQHW